MIILHAYTHGPWGTAVYGVIRRTFVVCTKFDLGEIPGWTQSLAPCILSPHSIMLRLSRVSTLAPHHRLTGYFHRCVIFIVIFISTLSNKIKEQAWNCPRLPCTSCSTRLLLNTRSSTSVLVLLLLLLCYFTLYCTYY